MGTVAACLAIGALLLGSGCGGSRNAVPAPTTTAPEPGSTASGQRFAEHPSMTMLAPNSYAVAMSDRIMAGDVTPHSDHSDQHPFVYDLRPDARKTVELPTLGGDRSDVKAVSGDVLVGTSFTGTAGFQHAFAYKMDKATAKMVDLGTLGGPVSSAQAVSGDIVVGMSLTPTGATHAFAYDLGAATPKMRDLGTLGGRDSEATGISGHIVIGSASLSSAAIHAFVYDLAAASPHMVDLGTLGGENSGATAIGGNIVIGGYTPAGNTASHAFVYDLRATSPHMRDLGTLGGQSCSRSGCIAATANAVDGNVVVGSSYTPDGKEHAFVYDLAASKPKMTPLSAALGDISTATGVSGDVIIGSVGPPDGIPQPFYYDLRATSPSMITLPGLEAVTVKGTRIAGEWQQPGGAEHAVIWDLTRPASLAGAPPAPSVRVGDGSALLSWSAPADDGGSPITGYRVTPYIGGRAQPGNTYTWPATTQEVTGLEHGASYTFSVAAINGVGAGPESMRSSEVTPP